MSEEVENSDISPSVLDMMREAITLPELLIISETEDKYEVQFGKETYTISKGTVSKFVGGVTSDVRMSMESSAIPLAGTYIEQDETVPSAFKIPMMVHEIREARYIDAGFADAHDRAVHDEMLYVLRYLPTHLHASYFTFAKKYRHAAVVQEERTRITEETEREDSLKREAAEYGIPARERTVAYRLTGRLLGVGLSRFDKVVTTFDGSYGKSGSEDAVCIVVHPPLFHAVKNERGEWTLEMKEKHPNHMDYCIVLQKKRAGLDPLVMEQLISEAVDCKRVRTGSEDYIEFDFDEDKVVDLLGCFNRVHEAVRAKRREELTLM